MYKKLIKQLRNNKHCNGCPYDKDCDEFDTCLIDLLAADAIEDMGKRIARLEKELQEKDKYIENEEYLFKTTNQVAPQVWCDTLKELVDKATPKKVRKETIKLDENDYINGFYFEEREVTYYYCPNCKEGLCAKFDYCCECGQRIDWE